MKTGKHVLANLAGFVNKEPREKRHDGHRFKKVIDDSKSVGEALKNLLYDTGRK